MTKESSEGIFYKIGGKCMVQSGSGKLKLKTKKEKCGETIFRIESRAQSQHEGE